MENHELESRRLLYRLENGGLEEKRLELIQAQDVFEHLLYVAHEALEKAEIHLRFIAGDDNVEYEREIRDPENGRLLLYRWK